MKYDPMAGGARCDLCPLRGSPVVPPEGPMNPDVVFVGEGPGINEERQGRPFVGASGVKLQEWLDANDTDRSRVWITNATLCRPDTPGVSGPKRHEFATFLAWIRAENARRRRAVRLNGGEFVEIHSPLKCCATRLWRELRYFDHIARERGDTNGIIVFTLGNYSTLAVTGQLGITKLRGSPMAVDTERPKILEGT